MWHHGEPELFSLFSLSADGKLDFDSFVSIASNFVEEEDDEAMQQELKEAFRLYDKEGKVALVVCFMIGRDL